MLVSDLACHCDCYLLFKIDDLNLYILNLLNYVKTLKLKFNIDSDKVCYLILIKCAHYKYQYRYEYIRHIHNHMLSWCTAQSLMAMVIK